MGVWTVLEDTERAVRNASGEGRFFHYLIDRGWFHYLGRIKKSVRDNNSNKNKNVSPNILGRLLIYLGGPPR